MNNKGQTTILFSLIISALLIFTLTALEVGRIYMSKVKIRAVVHSTRTSMMADYNRELFERYHLLFMDPTYGTGSEAAAEEKINDYLEVSLNGEKGNGSCGYEFTVSELALADCKTVFNNNMELLKNQIVEYEKTAGIVHRAKELEEKMKGKQNGIREAAKETEINGVEIEVSAENTEEEGSISEEDVKDPRDGMKESLKFGTLAFVLPKDKSISKEEMDFSDAPSKEYEKEKEEVKDNGFQDIGFLKQFLNDSAKEEYGNLTKRAAFVDYVSTNFSNGVHQRDDSVMKCEAEYILKGKSNDYDNLEAVVDEITWLRMPVNYAYLLTDTQKKSEALTMATAICAATGTAPLVDVVKYLLLGCWAYGETLSEIKMLLSGGEISIIKTSENWSTDLESLCTANQKEVKDGLCYEDFIMLLLAKKGEEKLNTCYARMLDVIEKNLQKNDEDFKVINLVGEMTIQGKVSVNPLFFSGKDKENYDCYFEEKIAY